ncbi:DUF4138 domain-containing protein [Leeuwenhoekiella sp. MAR_2009_132]|uniref:DUF4138 domain-containing protein n=1 Tax=Leeuwenhoekiella sp. MAR_2009_132 TaxID=1392489 RepID=UPI000490AAE2|nr:DUF4138 domain-containing protein [Leeuwenhoekiella sp. MAR_2009_132]
MKTLPVLIALLISFFCSAQQQPLTLDTIYANDQKNVALFFPSPIRQGITGSENFVFTYNREKQQYFGLLQAKPGIESNLLVFSSTGSIFSYIVCYKKELNKLTYFIKESSSIGNENPKFLDSLDLIKPENPVADNDAYYRRACSYLLNQDVKIGRIKNRNAGIRLSVENIVFDKEELYFVIQIENKSSLDYDLNFLKLAIQTRQKGTRKSVQRSYKEPLFICKLPERIAANETVKLVYVMPKFSLSDDRKVLLSLNEQNGERNVELVVSHKYINNPN